VRISCPVEARNKLDWIFIRGVILRRATARETLEVVDPDPSWIRVELRDRAAIAWTHRLEFLEFSSYDRGSSLPRVEEVI
jgi:hypothetical protein